MPRASFGQSEGTSPEAPRAQIKLVATDLDGTLLGPDGHVSERTVAAVRRARRAGLHVIPVTGRPPRLVWDIAEEADLGPLGICSNGAVIVDLESGEVLELQTLASDITRTLVTLIRGLFSGIRFALDGLEGIACEEGFIEPGWDWGDPVTTVSDILEVVEPSSIKLIVRRPGWPATELLSKLEDEVAEEARVTTSGLDWVEIGAPGISKAYAMERVCTRLGIRVSEVLAVGDNHNDLPVLAWAGHAAAPANAIPEVLAVVEQVLPSHRDDGVAMLLENLAASLDAAPRTP